MKDLRDLICYEMDSLIPQIEAIEATEIKNEEYFKKLFDSILYEPKKLTA